ncbi:MAG TPA: hypothetical protein VF187_11245 [Gemmatimonadales bacterium]
MAKVIKRITARHRTAAMLRARGYSYSQIAAEMGVTDTAVSLWMSTPAVKELIAQYQRRAVELAESILIDAVPEVARNQAKLALTAQSEHVQVQAGRDVLDRAGVRRPSAADEQGIVLRIHLD